MIQWLDEFYGDADLRQSLLESFLPVFSSYVAEATGGPVAATFVQALAQSYVERHLGSSRAQLQEVLTDTDDPIAALSQRFTEWEEKRPGKVARNELVRSANAAQVEHMRSQGVTRKVWRSTGKTCPFCKSMNGRTIEIDKTFFDAGDEFHPEGAESPMTMTSGIGHPPIHQGCDCSIEASTETEQVEVVPLSSDEAQDRLYELGAEAPDFWEFDAQTRAEVVTGFEKVAARYPRAFDNWKGDIRLSDQMNPRALANNGVGKYDNLPGGIYTLSLNRSKWTDRPSLLKQLAEDEAAGWAAKGASTPESAIVHEIGHMLNSATDHAGSRLVEPFPGVSGYGATDTGERFAEAVRAVFYMPEDQWTDEVRVVANFLEQFK